MLTKMPSPIPKKFNMPTIITILGGTGDLSKKKLIPALFDLHERNLLPDVFNIVGVARTPLSDLQFREFVRKAIEDKGHGHKTEMIRTFLKFITYQEGDFAEGESYKQLSDKLIQIESTFGQCSNKLFYLAVSPAYYDVIFRNLADSGLTIPCSQDAGWTRVLVEKPFGKDITTAQELDKTLGLLFKESQIFRIDHYLGKETLQNILMFRFSNLIFEPLWNNTYIEKVEIKMKEDLGMEGRGAFYDSVGALRDVGQNHILQMLSFIAMENPGKLNAESVRKARAKVLKDLKSISPKGMEKFISRGQYKGYKDEPNVAPDSLTETYFRITAFVNNKRWKGVPFYLESGKGLDEKVAEINVYFKNTETCLCPPDTNMHHQNVLRFRIQPDEGISILFWAKHAGFTYDLEPKELSFLYDKGIPDARIPEAYERILFDSISGEQILFASTDEVDAAWNFITPILENWQDIPLQEYERGSKGPRPPENT